MESFGVSYCLLKSTAIPRNTKETQLLIILPSRTGACLRLAKTGVHVCLTTNITRLNAAAKKVWPENIVK